MRAVLILGAAALGGILIFACATGDDESTNASGDAGAGSNDATTSSNADGAQNNFTNDAGAASDAGAADSGIDSGPACVPDAGCTTTDPGACAAGAISCSASGVATCVPRVTTQSCFESDAGTPGVGICKAGTQTCTGTLGACSGDVEPLAAEDCFNDLDDNCDGKINEGCPSTVSIGTPRTLTAQGGAGGVATSVMCPTGAFVTRVDSWFDDNDTHASGVSIYCATPTLVQGATSYSISLTANAPAPYATAHGSNDPKDERTDDCGLSGLVAITYVVGYEDTYVEALGNHCGTGTVTLAPATNKLTLNFTTDGNESYSAYSNVAGTFFDQDCNAGEVPSNQVLVGFNLHDGDWLDNLQPICAPLVVNYSAGTPDP